MLFPEGRYTHRVQIHLPTQKNYEFDSIVAVSPETIKVVGLGFLNATAFRLTENRTDGKVEVEIFYEPMKKYERRLRQFYSHLRAMLLLEWKGSPTDTVELKGFKIHFKEYDEHQIPQRIQILRPEFTVEVEVVGYEI